MTEEEMQKEMQQYLYIANSLMQTYMSNDIMSAMHYNYILYTKLATGAEIEDLNVEAVNWLYDIQNVFLDLANCYLKEYVHYDHLIRVSRLYERKSKLSKM